MRKIEISDALIELAEGIILQAIDDLRGLRKRGAFVPGGLNTSLWGRRKDTGGMKCPMNFRSGNDALELVHFFEGWPLDFLCDLTGHKACRIRKKLGITKKEVL